MSELTLLTYEERLAKIIQLSYDLLCGKIVGCDVEVNNEASLQHHLSLILKHIGQQFLFAKEDTNSEIKLAPFITQSAQRTVAKKKNGVVYSKHQKVDLDYMYVANWDNYDSKHYFLKIDLQDSS